MPPVSFGHMGGECHPVSFRHPGGFCRTVSFVHRTLFQAQPLTRITQTEASSSRRTRFLDRSRIVSARSEGSAAPAAVSSLHSHTLPSKSGITPSLAKTIRSPSLMSSRICSALISLVTPTGILVEESLKIFPSRRTNVGTAPLFTKIHLPL